MWKFPGSMSGGIDTTMEDIWLAQQRERERKNVTLPKFIRRRIERAIHESTQHQQGMSVHDGRVRVYGSDLAYMLRLIDELTRSGTEPPQTQPADRSPHPPTSR